MNKIDFYICNFNELRVYFTV
ncbi:protein of unknown function [Citrobacter amalonaticus]|uniref:Uncharacterized protein n=2 Tax=Citrobacter TaxID=544 RepID=A0AAX2BGF1_CITAM|nr:protein of unknown function [Citrobacter amalonaticus]SAZ29087.1 protein of unknown function [Citrobacter amalonaticus]SBV69504.1 hypothetical protein KL86CIT2_740015 [uncultured Citrobacter sp.]